MVKKISMSQQRSTEQRLLLIRDVVWQTSKC